MKWIYVVLFCFVTLGFSDVESDKSSKEFYLPDESSVRISFGCFDDERKEYLRSWSSIKGGSYIETFDFNTGKLKHSDFFPDVSQITGFVRLGESHYSIFDASARAYYIFKDGVQLAHVAESDEISKMGAFETSVLGMQFNPLIFQNGSVIHTSGFLRLYKPFQVDNRHRDAGLLRVVNLTAGTVSAAVPLPEHLEDVDYGELNQFSTVKRGDQLIVAPFYSNELLVVDLKSMNYIYPIVTKNDYYLVTYPYADMSRSIPDNRPFYDGMSRHRIESRYYTGILYDNYRKVFYRILMSRDKSSATGYGMEVVVFDDLFGFQSAHKIHGNYRTDGMFVSEDGLNILNHTKSGGEVKTLSFDTFTF